MMAMVAHIQRLSGRFLFPIYLEAEYWLGRAGGAPC